MTINKKLQRFYRTFVWQICKILKESFSLSSVSKSFSTDSYDVILLRCQGPVPSILLLFWLNDDIIIPSLWSEWLNETTRYSGAVVSQTSFGREPTIRESAELYYIVMTSVVRNRMEINIPYSGKFSKPTHL